MEKLRIVVGGYIGLYPTGGVTWDYIQYPLGFHLLGHDIFYIEDTGQYSCYKSEGKAWNDPTDTIQFLEKTMIKFGLEERWAYRDVGTGKCFGMSLEKVNDICKTADVFINISASTLMRDEYLSIPRRILIDSDPMFTQVQDWDDSHENESIAAMQKNFRSYTHLFSFGENIGKDDCRIPTYDLKWNTTRQPICLDFWRMKNTLQQRGAFTTIMSWSIRKNVIYKKESWGQKDVEFEKIINIPLTVRGSNFKIILADNSKQMDHLRLESYGWKLLDPLKTINNAEEYKQFIHESLGEFSVAKETYVKSKSGWFSCRSACYLAAGKPVITQDTGWTNYIPSGEGLLAFDDLPSAITSLEEISSNIEKHTKAALRIAKEFFNSDKVLEDILNIITSKN